MNLLRRLSQRHLLQQYASVFEQMLLSGSNMLTSIVVLKVSSVADFGIYSFVFVLGTLITGFFATLLHRQMMLEIASEDNDSRNRVFRATIALQAIGLIVFLMILTLLLFLIDTLGDTPLPWPIAMAGAMYVLAFIIFDGFKQFCYTTGNQVYSLRCTVIHVAMQMLLLGLIVWHEPEDNVVAIIYLSLCASLLVSLFSNRLCIHSLLQGEWRSWNWTWQVFRGFFRQGRFSLLGMSVTWIQNQSMNPFLMLISGPTVAGYFSLGRLLTMPLAVVSQGLVNSSTPTLRRLYKQEGKAKIVPGIRSYLYKTGAFAIAYITLLFVAHLTGLLQRFVPDYSEVQFYLLIWIVLMCCTIVRFWNGQFFVVSMDFRFLLRVSIIALIVTVSGMLVFGLGLESIQLALTSVILGELVALLLYGIEQRKQLGLARNI